MVKPTIVLNNRRFFRTLSKLSAIFQVVTCEPRKNYDERRYSLKECGVQYFTRFG